MFSPSNASIYREQTVSATISSGAMPFSTSGTKSGQAREMTRTAGSAARMCVSYAPLLIVACVPITPTERVFVTLAASRAALSITP